MLLDHCTLNALAILDGRVMVSPAPQCAMLQSRLQLNLVRLLLATMKTPQATAAIAAIYHLQFFFKNCQSTRPAQEEHAKPPDNALAMMGGAGSLAQSAF
jgi:hypothetical protein